MEGGDSTRGLCRSCPQALPPAPGWRSSDQADVAARGSIRQPDEASQPACLDWRGQRYARDRSGTLRLNTESPMAKGTLAMARPGLMWAGQEPARSPDGVRPIAPLSNPAVPSTWRKDSE